MPACLASSRLKSHDHDDEHADDEEHEHEEAHADDEKHEHEEAHAGDEEHAHEETHAHEDEHAHEGDDHDTHSEVVASYRLECEEGAIPSTFTATIIERFPGIEALQVEFVGPGGQSAELATAGSAEISLEPVL